MNSKWICLCLATGLAIGCGDGIKDKPTLGEASGIVRFEKKPLADATLTFYPEKGPPSVGKSDANGAFQMKTNGALGVVVGPHKVTVQVVGATDKPPPMDGKEMLLLKKSVLPKKYASADTTDLNINIPAEGDSGLTLDLTP